MNLFVIPGLRFTIGARGGRIEITTASAPWRDYLILGRFRAQ